MRRWQRNSLAMLAVPALLYVIVLFSFWRMQEELIFGGHVMQGSEDCRIAPVAGVEVVTISEGSEGRITALFGGALAADGTPRPDAGARPTVIFFYGNGGCAGRAHDHVDALRRQGLNVIVPDYPGYGMSAGAPAEAGCARAADHAYDHLVRHGVEPRRIVSMGESLGGAVAIDLAARRPVGALVACGAFTSMADMAALQYPWLAASLILRHPFDNAGKIGRVASPIFLAHGTADRLVPHAMMARLAALAHAPVTRLDAVGAGHNDLLVWKQGHVIAAVGAFVERIYSARP